MLNTKLALVLVLAAAPVVRAQAHEHEMSPDAMNGEHHMEMTALRHGTAADSARAAGVAAVLPDALKPYADTAAAVADGYKMFMPQVKEQKDGHAVFGPASPVDTREACDAVGGVFHDTMFAGNDPKTIWGDDHRAHDAHDGLMKMGMDR